MAATKTKAKAASTKGAANKSGAKGSTALATVKSGGKLATAEAAKRMREISARASGHGFEARDLAIPFISILQAKSKPCLKSNEKYVEGAKEGMIFDNVTNKLWDGEEGIIGIPIAYTRRWTQWKTRDSKGGGGFIKDWGTDEESAMALVTETDDKGRNLVGKDEQIVESGDFYIFAVNPETGAVDRGIVSMTSSNWRTAKRLNSLISQWEEPVDPEDLSKGTFNPAMFMRPYHFTSMPASNDQGEWMVWKVEPYRPEDFDEDRSFTTFDLPNGAAIVNSAETFRKSIEKGEVKVATPSEDMRDEAEGGEGNGKF